MFTVGAAFALFTVIVISSESLFAEALRYSAPGSVKLSVHLATPFEILTSSSQPFTEYIPFWSAPTPSGTERLPASLVEKGVDSVKGCEAPSIKIKAVVPFLTKARWYHVSGRGDQSLAIL